MPLENLVIIGKISKPQGINGEVRLWLDSVSKEDFIQLKEVILESPTGEKEAFLISHSKIHKDFIKVKFRGIESRNQADELRNYLVKVPRNTLASLLEGNYYNFDVINFQVITNKGVLVGKLTEIWHLPANDVYVVSKEGGKEFLIPVIDDIILNVDLERKEVIIFPMEGLLDI